LIELMTVIFIISMLVAILVPNMMRARERAQLTSCESNLKSRPPPMYCMQMIMADVMPASRRFWRPLPQGDAHLCLGRKIHLLVSGKHQP